MPRAAAMIDNRAIDLPAYHPVPAAIILPLLLAVPLLAVLLIARRATGALAHPLPPTGLIACGLFLAIWAVIAHGWLASCCGSKRNLASRRIWRNPSVWLPPAVLLLACYALLLPGSSTVGAAGLIAALVFAEAAAWSLRRREQLSSPRPATHLPATHLPATGLPTEAQAVGAANPPGDGTEEVIAETVRHRESDGREAIRGWVQVELAAGQRTAPVHVAFCPALAGLPNCEAEQVEGPPATIRVAQVLPYGARFDVKLDAPAPEPVTVRIEFAATASTDVGRFD